MKRHIGVLTHQIPDHQLPLLMDGISDFGEYLAKCDLSVAIEQIGTLESICKQSKIPVCPRPREDNTYNEAELTCYLGVTLKEGARHYLQRHTDIIVCFPNLITTANCSISTTTNYPTPAWHEQMRGGYLYGLGDANLFREGGSAGVSTGPVDDLSQQQHKQKYLQYIFRHEMGHVLGGFTDLPICAQDNIMKPIPFATPHFLDSKNIEYTPEQIRQIQENLETINTKSYTTWLTQKDNPQERIRISVKMPIRKL